MTTPAELTSSVWTEREQGQASCVSGRSLDGRHARVSPASSIKRVHRTFQRSYRTEVLNAHLFESNVLRALTNTWLRFYNDERTHRGYRLRGRTPATVFRGAVAA